MLQYNYSNWREEVLHSIMMWSKIKSKIYTDYAPVGHILLDNLLLRENIHQQIFYAHLQHSHTKILLHCYATNFCCLEEKVEI